MISASMTLRIMVFRKFESRPAIVSLPGATTRDRGITLFGRREKAHAATFRPPKRLDCDQRHGYAPPLRYQHAVSSRGGWRRHEFQAEPGAQQRLPHLPRRLRLHGAGPEQNELRP